MSFFSNIRIGGKLLFSFGLMILFIGIIGVTSYSSLNHINKTLGSIFSIQLPSIDYLIEADRDLQQLLVAERSMMFTENGSELFKFFLDEYNTNLSQANERWNKYKALATTDEEKALFSPFENARKSWKAFSRRAVDLASNSELAERQDAISLSLGDAKTKFEEMREYINTLTEMNLSNAGIAREKAHNVYKRALTILFIGILFGVFAGSFLSFAITKNITRPVNRMVGGLKAIAQGEGDLTQRLPEGGNDEIGELARWFNTFMEKLQEIIKETVLGVETLFTSATELSSVSEQMSGGIKNITEKTNTISSAAVEMNESIGDVAGEMDLSSTNIDMVATATEEMSITVSEIAQNAEKARCISNEAAQKAKAASENMNQLDDAAKSIGMVTETITEISEQTNLLALNATIEAARAGEAGLGFAVVANEIKELAKQTATATLDIREKIAGIQSAMANTIGEISSVTSIIGDVDNVVVTIATAVEEQSTTTADIAKNVSEVSSGIQNVNENFSKSSSVTSEISNDISGVSMAMEDIIRNGGQVSQSAQNLFKLSENLKSLVGKFRT